MQRPVHASRTFHDYRGQGWDVRAEGSPPDGMSPPYVGAQWLRGHADTRHFVSAWGPPDWLDVREAVLWGAFQPASPGEVLLRLIAADQGEWITDLVGEYGVPLADALRPFRQVLNTPIANGHTAIVVAMNSGNHAAFEALLDAGALVYQRMGRVSPTRPTAWEIAHANLDADLMRMLLRRSPSLSSADTEECLQELQAWAQGDDAREQLYTAVTGQQIMRPLVTTLHSTIVSKPEGPKR